MPHVYLQELACVVKVLIQQVGATAASMLVMVVRLENTQAHSLRCQSDCPVGACYMRQCSCRDGRKVLQRP